MRNIAKFSISCLLIVSCLIFVAPAKAFYFEVPKVLKDLWPLSVKAQEAKESVLTTPDQTMMPVQPETPSQSIINNPPADTCRVNGVDQPGSCADWNQKIEMQPAQPQSGQMNEPGQINEPREMNKPGPNQEQMLKDMKRGANDIDRQLKKFKSMIVKFEKKGIIISDDIKIKMDELNALIQKFQSATSVEEIADLDMNDLQGKMQDLEQERQNLEQMDNIMREMKRIESSVKMFEKQVQKLAKQKVAAPAEVADNLAKIKSLIADIKVGKMDNAQDIFDLIQQLDQNRGEMEMLARWPQTVKEMNQQVKNLEKELKRDKTIVDRLKKKGVDLSSIYSQFEEAIGKLKETREEAKTQISDDVSGTFEKVQNDFFGQLDDVWENSKIIAAMSNFARFRSDSNRELNKAQQQINALKKKKIDTSELEDLLAQVKGKVAEIKELIGAKPLDPDAIIDVLSDLQNLNQDFGDKTVELTGMESVMPWEKGPQQFQSIQVTPNLDKLIPRQPAVAPGEGG